MCGEHGNATYGVTDGVGSSPHVRGAPVVTPLPVAANGIIPACAGSTNRKRLVQRKAWDHPRMCGEHTFAELDEIRAEGSSPHVRGAPMR